MKIPQHYGTKETTTEARASRSVKREEGFRVPLFIVSVPALETTVPSSRQRGMGMVLAMFFVTLAAVLLAAVSMRVFAQAKHIEHLLNFDKALQGAESAQTAALANFEAGGTGDVGSEEVPKSLRTMPDIHFRAQAEEWANDARDNDNNGAVDDGTEQGIICIHASGNASGCLRRIETLYRRDSGGIYTRIAWREVPPNETR